MNVIVDEEVVRTNSDVGLKRVDVKATEDLGERQMGLDMLLGTESRSPFLEWVTCKPRATSSRFWPRPPRHLRPGALKTH